MIWLSGALSAVLTKPRRAQPPAVGTTAQPYTAGRLPFFVIAVRKSASEVPLRFIDALRSAPDIVRSQPRTASLLSENSVLLADFFQSRVLAIRCPDPAAGGVRPPAVGTTTLPYTACRATPAAAAFCVLKILRRAGARRALRGAPRSACPAAVVHDSRRRRVT